jgi:hypothetical protein
MSPRKTMPGGIPIQSSQYTPTPVLVEASSPQPAIGSRVFVMAISTLLGIVVATTTIVGFTGRYFYVDRSEYSDKSVREAEDRGKLQNLLGRVEATLSQQTITLSRLEATVREIELKQASGRR